MGSNRVVGDGTTETAGAEHTCMEKGGASDHHDKHSGEAGPGFPGFPRPPEAAHGGVGPVPVVACFGRGRGVQKSGPTAGV
eukprot:15430648-Alexandrium_andersonii.AAC.1